MVRVLALILCLIGNAAFAGDLNNHRPFWPSRLQVLVLMNLALFTYSALAQDNSTTAPDNSTAPASISCTPYFVFWNTWLGNVFGIIDSVGWTTDWLAAWFFYAKPDRPVVQGIKKKIAEHQKTADNQHSQQLIAAANICEILANHLENNYTNATKEQILHCMALSHESLKEEANHGDHVECINRKR
jgi:hypothetical protein